MKLYLSLGTVLLAAVVSHPHFAAQDAGPPVSTGAAARFLNQASWGPTPATVIEVQQEGFEKWLDRQFAMPPSPITDAPAGTRNLSPLQQQFFFNAVNGQDQLRQRVAFALSEIWVVSGIKIRLPEAVAPYLRLLAADAFGNYYDLMKDMTLNPAMGHYLDMVNNDKPNPQAGRSADENYARELMQLFTLGEVLLNSDGSPKPDQDGSPIPAYTEQTVQNLARAFTGWTYPPAPGSKSRMHNPPYWDGQMVAFNSNHDQDAKALLYGMRLPAGQDAATDLDQALGNVFNHPNVGPFISTQLIQHLVTSNPSPAYVSRVAAVFADNGAGVRGDLKAVVSAILLDPEARTRDSAPAAASAAHPGPASFVAAVFRTVGRAVSRTVLPEPAPREVTSVPENTGHLKEPVLYITGLLRALGAKVADSNALAGYASQMGQNLYYAPSVFSYFAPRYRIPGTNLLGPEFQIYSTSTAIIRANFVNSLIFGHVGQGSELDLSPFQALSVPDLLDTLDTLMMNGQAPLGTRQSVLTATNTIGNEKLRTQTAIYLIATSSLYQVAH